MVILNEVVKTDLFTNIVYIYLYNYRSYSLSPNKVDYFPYKCRSILVIVWKKNQRISSGYYWDDKSNF